MASPPCGICMGWNVHLPLGLQIRPAVRVVGVVAPCSRYRITLFFRAVRLNSCCRAEYGWGWKTKKPSSLTPVEERPFAEDATPYGAGIRLDGSLASASTPSCRAVWARGKRLSRASAKKFAQSCSEKLLSVLRDMLALEHISQPPRCQTDVENMRLNYRLTGRAVTERRESAYTGSARFLPRACF